MQHTNYVTFASSAAVDNLLLVKLLYQHKLMEAHFLLGARFTPPCSLRTNVSQRVQRWINKFSVDLCSILHTVKLGGDGWWLLGESEILADACLADVYYYCRLMPLGSTTTVDVQWISGWSLGPFSSLFLRQVYGIGGTYVCCFMLFQV